MENELELNLDELDRIEANSEEKLKVKNRFEKLSEKVILTAKEKEQAEAKVKAEAEARSKAEKERDFYKDFSQLSSKYPDAVSYQDKILEKVNGGYSPEDATLAILAKEGKLGGMQAPAGVTTAPITQGTGMYAGGSASTAITDTMDKDISQMTREEMRNALMQAEKEGANLLKP